MRGHPFMSTQSKIELKEQTCGRMRVLKGEQGERKLTFMNFRYTEIKKDIEINTFSMAHFLCLGF